MRIGLVIIFLAASAFAQDQSAVAKAACGPDDVDFEIKLDKSKHGPTPPEPGKARVYFIQDIGRVSCIGTCVKTRIGVDGTWAGAIRNNSYFSISVEPGEHHMCEIRRGCSARTFKCRTRQNLLLSHTALWQ
jgi:hypothetical protein